MHILRICHILPDMHIMHNRVGPLDKCRTICSSTAYFTLYMMVYIMYNIDVIIVVTCGNGSITKRGRLVTV